MDNGVLNDVKYVGFYSSTLLTREINKKISKSKYSMPRNPDKYFFVSDIVIPHTEVDILIHTAMTADRLLFIPKDNGYAREAQSYDTERYYLAVLFLLPELDKELDESSPLSVLVHNERVYSKLIKLREVIKNKAGKRKIRRILSELFMQIRVNYPINKIEIFDGENGSKIREIREIGSYDMINVKSIVSRFQNPHTLDIVYGQIIDVDMLFNDENNEKKYLLQKSAMDKYDKLPTGTNWVFPPILFLIFLAVVYMFASLIGSVWIVMDCGDLSVFMESSAVKTLISTVLTVFILSMYTPYCIFEKDRIVFDMFLDDFDMSRYDGIYSYYRLTQYGTFRKWGMKYIYFSKKDMTDEEFRKFKRKIIPHDYNSIAVPYKKAYMKIAEHLVFTTRKDR